MRSRIRRVKSRRGQPKRRKRPLRSKQRKEELRKIDRMRRIRRKFNAKKKKQEDVREFLKSKQEENKNLCRNRCPEKMSQIEDPITYECHDAVNMFRDKNNTCYHPVTIMKWYKEQKDKGQEIVKNPMTNVPFSKTEYENLDDAVTYLNRFVWDNTLEEYKDASLYNFERTRSKIRRNEAKRPKTWYLRSLPSSS